MRTEDYPKTIFELKERFATEEVCLQYLAQLRWPEGFICPRCGHHGAWDTKRGLYRCCQCECQVSVTAGTVFQDTRKPLQLWFRAMWHITSRTNGVSALSLQRVLRFKRYETVWIWLHKLRSAMVCPVRDRLSGIIEVDEMYINVRKPGKQGLGAQGKILVVIAVEDKGSCLGRIRLRRATDASATSLVKAVQEIVVQGSVVRTDGWGGYVSLSSGGYKHMVARSCVDSGENQRLLTYRVAVLLKRWIADTHQGAVRESHIDYYLDEFTFRFNRRASLSDGTLFYRLVQQAIAIAPITSQDIYGQGQP